MYQFFFFVWIFLLNWNLGYQAYEAKTTGAMWELQKQFVSLYSEERKKKVQFLKEGFSQLYFIIFIFNYGYFIFFYIKIRYPWFFPLTLSFEICRKHVQYIVYFKATKVLFCVKIYSIASIFSIKNSNVQRIWLIFLINQKTDLDCLAYWTGVLFLYFYVHFSLCHIFHCNHLCIFLVIFILYTMLSVKTQAFNNAIYLCIL